MSILIQCDVESRKWLWVILKKKKKTSFSFSLFSPYSGKFVQYVVLVFQEVQIFKMYMCSMYYASGYIQYIYSNQLVTRNKFMLIIKGKNICIILLNSFQLMLISLDRTSTGSLIQRVAALYWKERFPAVMFQRYN